MVAKFIIVIFCYSNLGERQTLQEQANLINGYPLPNVEFEFNCRFKVVLN